MCIRDRAVALLVDWAAQSNIAAVRVLHQLLEGTRGGDKNFQKAKKRLQYVKTKLKTYTMAERAYSPESTNARLLSNFYLPDPPPLLTLKQQWKCDATVASLDAFAFIEPIHTDTALGNRHRQRGLGPVRHGGPRGSAGHLQHGHVVHGDHGRHRHRQHNHLQCHHPAHRAVLRHAAHRPACVSVSPGEPPMSSEGENRPKFSARNMP